MSNILTSRTVIKSLNATSLSKHAITADNHRDNTSIAKDRQDTSYTSRDRLVTKDHSDDTSVAKDRQHTSQSLRDRLATEDHLNDTSTASNEHDVNHSLGDLSKDESILGYRSPLTYEDTDFCAAVLFCKQFLEIEKTQDSFWKANVLQADSDYNPRSTAIDDINIARSNNQSVLKTNNFPVSVNNTPSKSLQSFDTIEEYPKHIHSKRDRYKPRREKASKRVLSEVRKTTMVILDSDDEEEMEMINADDSLSDRPIKRPRLAKEDKTIPVTTRLSSSEESVKASSDDEAKGRPKSRTYTRVTEREFKGHFNTEATWLNTASTRYNTLCKLFAKQKRHITALDVLDAEHCQILAEMSADRLLRSTRLRLGKELQDLEKRRSEMTAELRQTMNSDSNERAAMKQDLEQWSVKEKKVTERIERSR